MVLLLCHSSECGFFLVPSLVFSLELLLRYNRQGCKAQNLKSKCNTRTQKRTQYRDEKLAYCAQMGSECPIKGMRITITGRLGSRKKAMAQQISKCVGKQQCDERLLCVSPRRGPQPLATPDGLQPLRFRIAYACLKPSCLFVPFLTVASL